MNIICDNLIKIADIYRARMDSYAEKNYVFSKLEDGDAIVFISRYIDEQDYNSSGQKADILVDAYNSIKHGYNVWRDKNSFEQLSEDLSGSGFKYVASATIEEKKLQVDLKHLEIIKTMEESLVKL